MKRKSKYFYRYRDADTGHYLTEAQALRRRKDTWVRHRHLRANGRRG